jgi:ATP-binding cassette, subfamily B, multidrug efflux pump
VSELASLNKYLFRYKWLILLGIACVVLSNLFAIYIPVFVRLGIDDALWISQNISLIENDLLYGAALKTVLGFGVAIFVASLLKGIFLFLMRQTLIVTSRNIEYDQKNEIFQKYERLSEEFYRNHYTGDLMSRISEDVSNVRMYIGPSIMYFANVLFSFIMIVAQMLMINTSLTIWVLLPLPFLSYSIYIVSKKINIGNKRIQEQLSLITTKAQETFAGIRIIKSFGAERHFNKDFLESGKVFQAKNLQLAKVNAIFFPLMTLLMGLSTILVLYIGGWEVKAGRFTPGNVAEFIIYLNMLIWPVASLGWTTALVQKASASQKRINEFLNEPEQPDTGLTPFPDFQKLTLNVPHYQYLDKDYPALQDMELEISKGQFIGLIGKTGSGKTTVIQLLTRQLEIQKGYYNVDDADMSDFALSAFRSKVAYVQQDTFLFSDTLRENIVFGSESEVSEEELQKVIGFASLGQDIAQFPKGLDTVIGERGVSLSGGQKQRMSLARALMRNADVYIFDDCLSAVDAETEAAIIDKLKIALKGKTIIMSSHRIAPILKADEIWVLDSGKLSGKGSHEILVETNEYYSWLFENQSLES